MEFSIIKQYFTGLGATIPEEVSLAIGDDCALFSKAGVHHVMSIDTAVAGVHFPAGADWYDIAYRAVGCAASDLAAMAAVPAFATLAITLPSQNNAHLASLSRGFDDALKQAGLALIGGDTTSGKQLVVTLSVHGWANTPVKRSTAKKGDLVMISGQTGMAGAALEFLDKPQQMPANWYKAYWRPSARFDVIEAVSQNASACIDVSDGLLADLNHICQASNLSAKVNANQLDLSWREHLSHDRALKLALTAGDDYQLLCAVPERNETAMKAAGFRTIGTFDAAQQQTAQVMAWQDGQPLTYDQLGYIHSS